MPLHQKSEGSATLLTGESLPSQLEGFLPGERAWSDQRGCGQQGAFAAGIALPPDPSFLAYPIEAAVNRGQPEGLGFLYPRPMLFNGVAIPPISYGPLAQLANSPLLEKSRTAYTAAPFSAALTFIPSNIGYAGHQPFLFPPCAGSLEMQLSKGQGPALRDDHIEDHGFTDTCSRQVLETPVGDTDTISSYSRAYCFAEAIKTGVDGGRGAIREIGDLGCSLPESVMSLALHEARKRPYDEEQTTRLPFDLAIPRVHDSETLPQIMSPKSCLYKCQSEGRLATSVLTQMTGSNNGKLQERKLHLNKISPPMQNSHSLCHSFPGCNLSTALREEQEMTRAGHCAMTNVASEHPKIIEALKSPIVHKSSHHHPTGSIMHREDKSIPNHSVGQTPGPVEVCSCESIPPRGRRARGGRGRRSGGRLSRSCPSSFLSRALRKARATEDATTNIWLPSSPSSLSHSFPGRSLSKAFRAELGGSTGNLHVSTSDSGEVGAVAFASDSDEELTNLDWLHESKNLLRSLSFGAGPGSLLQSLSPTHDAAEGSLDGTGKAENPDFCEGGAVAKPPYSFSCLIFLAIECSSEKRLLVRDIYKWILDNFPYFAHTTTGWKNSVRHNLSLNKCFRRVERDKKQGTGKGSLWCVDSEYRPGLLQTLGKASCPFYAQIFRAPLSSTKCRTERLPCNTTRMNESPVNEKHTGLHDDGNHGSNSFSEQNKLWMDLRQETHHTSIQKNTTCSSGGKQPSVSLLEKISPPSSSLSKDTVLPHDVPLDLRTSRGHTAGTGETAAAHAVVDESSKVVARPAKRCPPIDTLPLKKRRPANISCIATQVTNLDDVKTEIAEGLPANFELRSWT
uniref:uncharacterized protein n=1 Tax=Myxine glutinosa TaxID=7769 RepID=UPI00358F29E6